MKKIFIILVVLIFFNKVYGVSDEFKFVIDTIGIPEYNVYNNQINEYIYNNYNIFVYGGPNDISDLYQRFKKIGQGKIINNNIRGEFLYLGFDYSGNYISNVYFPVDFVPEITPDKWNYISCELAYNSWNDDSKYIFKEQLEYMKYADMLFDEIKSNTTNPYNLVSYGITANSIGLNKVKLEACSTWKTNGILTIKRVVNGCNRYAIFLTDPIAEEAYIKSYIVVSDNIVITNKEDSTSVIINYGSRINNLNEYANKSHIKEIVSELYIDGVKVSEVRNTNIDNVSKDYLKTFIRMDKNENVIPISIKVKSYAYTYFSSDGILIDELKKDLNIVVEKKNSIIPVSIATLKKIDSNYYKVDLIETDETLGKSQGIIENGKYLILKLKLEDYIKIYINNLEINYDIIYENADYSIVKIKIQNIPNTINDFYILRSQNKDYYNIDLNQVGKRIRNPNELIVSYLSGVQNIYFDTINHYYYNFNYYIPNSEDGKKEMLIEEW